VNAWTDDVLGERLDRLIALERLARQDVSAGDETYQTAIFHHRDVPEPLVGDELFAFLNLGLGRTADHGSGHDLTDRGRFRVAASGHDPNQNVALGEDADDLSVVEHHERSDASCVHLLRCFDHRSAAVDGGNVSPLVAQDVSYGRHVNHLRGLNNVDSKL